MTLLARLIAGGVSLESRQSGRLPPACAIGLMRTYAASNPTRPYRRTSSSNRQTSQEGPICPFRSLSRNAACRAAGWSWAGTIVSLCGYGAFSSISTVKRMRDRNAVQRCPRSCTRRNRSCIAGSRTPARVRRQRTRPRPVGRPPRPVLRARLGPSPRGAGPDRHPRGRRTHSRCRIVEAGSASCESRGECGRPSPARGLSPAALVAGTAVRQ